MMKQIIIILFFGFLSHNILAQLGAIETKHSVHFSLNSDLFWHTKKQYFNTGSSIELNVEFEYKKYIFAFNILGGNEINFLLNTKPSYSQYSLYCGRKIIKYKRFSIKGYAGLGVFTIDTSQQMKIRNFTIPLKLLPQIRLGERFSMGINLGLNYNQLAPYSTWGLNLMWTPKPSDYQVIPTD